MIETMYRKHLFSLVSASIMAVLGGGLCMPLGCAAADPNDPNGISAEENVSEAELAVGEGGACTAGGSECNTGLTCCNTGVPGICRNLQTDEDNCGTCGNECTGLKYCSAGHCCSPGATYCPGTGLNNGGCRYLDINREHCGECGTECQQGESCINGNCI